MELYSISLRVLLKVANSAGCWVVVPVAGVPVWGVQPARAPKAASPVIPMATALPKPLSPVSSGWSVKTTGWGASVAAKLGFSSIGSPALPRLTVSPGTVVAAAFEPVLAFSALGGVRMTLVLLSSMSVAPVIYSLGSIVAG